MGVIGMNLTYDDEVVAMQMNSQGDSILLVSEYGLGKRTSMEEFTVQYRGGKGVKCYKITEKTGNVIGAKAVNDENEVMLITTEGIIIQLEVSEVSQLGRITSGVKLIDLDNTKDIVVASLAKVREAVPEEGADDGVNMDDADKIEENMDMANGDGGLAEGNVGNNIGMSDNETGKIDGSLDKLLERAEDDIENN